MIDMSELKYKEGDKVRIKSLDWYNENKASDDEIRCYPLWFGKEHSKWCGKVMTISHVRADHYTMVEDLVEYWTDEMIESLIERNGKTYPYKIGDRVLLKGSNRCATITDLKYNSWGNLSYYVKIDNDKDISIDYPTDLLLPYDNMAECKVEEECPQDFIEKYCKSCGTQRCDRTKEYLNGCPYYNAYLCKKQNNDMEEKDLNLKFNAGDRVFNKVTRKWVNIIEFDIETDLYIVRYDDGIQGRSLESELCKTRPSFKEIKEVVKKKAEVYINKKTELDGLSKSLLYEGFVDGMMTALIEMEE